MPAKINPYFQNLTREYIFPQIEQKLAAFKKRSSTSTLINLGIGDVALPLCPSLARAIQEATQEMTLAEGKRGYGPSEGYNFLKETILSHEYAHYGIELDEVFISDGTNSDAANIQELFDPSTIVAVPDPAYPAYLDANILAGKKILFLPCVESEEFLPRPPESRADLVYLCTPSNPTGVALTHTVLQEWIDWARQERAILVIDNVYNCFATSPEIPDSIYALAGAKEVAIEMRSFSKMAGFTGLRCAYMIVPKSLHLPLHPLWMRRVNAKSNGVAYPIQKGAAAYFTPEGRKETATQIAVYKEAAEILRNGLQSLDQTFFGGVDAPYIWWKTPSPYTSWEFFDLLLEQCHLIAIPGSGFGKEGQGFMRLSCFTTPLIAREAVSRLSNLFAST